MVETWTLDLDCLGSRSRSAVYYLGDFGILSSVLHHKLLQNLVAGHGFILSLGIRAEVNTAVQFLFGPLVDSRTRRIYFQCVPSQDTSSRATSCCLGFLAVEIAG